MVLHDLITLDYAMEIIEEYCISKGVDSLSGIERMVKDYKILDTRQQLAVDRFMAEAKVDA